MEQQNDLEIGIGNKDPITLQPAKVKIMEAHIEEVGPKKNKILCLMCKHPEKDEAIKITKVKYLKGEKLITSTTWLNKDEDDLIQKGSGLAILLDFLKAEKPSELEGKECDTVTESKEINFLVLKAY